jgi:hypothetical protein
MYKIILTEKNARFTMQKIKIKKLFDFPFDVDLSSWVYSAREKLFFFINKYDRRMYCFNIKNIKKQDVQYKMYVKNNGFPVSAMKLHSNGRVLILLSEERDIIEYVDIKKYNSIRHLRTMIHEPLGRDKYIAQKMALSCEGDVLLLVAGRTCYAIEIPIEIREISFLEKSIMKMVCEQSGISKDIRKLIWYFLINLLKKEYVPSDTSSIKHHEVA